MNFVVNFKSEVEDFLITRIKAQFVYGLRLSPLAMTATIWSNVPAIYDI
jgi:hypothetical protein